MDLHWRVHVLIIFLISICTVIVPWFGRETNDLNENAININLFLGKGIMKQPESGHSSVICLICEVRSLGRSEVRDQNVKQTPGRVGRAGGIRYGSGE